MITSGGWLFHKSPKSLILTAIHSSIVSLTQLSTPEHNVSLLRRHFDEVLNQGHTQVVDEIYAPSYVLDAPVRTDGSSAGQGQTRGRDGLKQRVRLFRTAFPDIHFTVDSIDAEGEGVTVQYTFSGTQRAEFAGVPPTGRAIRVPGQLVARVADGLIQEAWSTFDAQDLLHQLGVDSA